MPSADQIKATLDHISLGTPDVAALSGFYRDVMGLNVKALGDTVWGQAKDRRIHFVPGPAKTLSYAAYRLADAEQLTALRARLVTANWPIEASPSPRFPDGLAVRDPDGNRLVFGLPATDVTGPEAQSDPVAPARLQHVVVASTDPSRVVDFFINVLGFVLSDNVVDDEGGVRVSFLRCSHEHHSFAVFKAPTCRLDHHCYEAVEWNAIRDWSDHMAERRIPLQWGPGRHGPGNNLFIFIHDLDGNWLEISAELEHVEADKPTGQWPHEERTLNTWGRGLMRS